MSTGRRRERNTSHVSAVAVRRLIGESRWQAFFTFCFERNPFERVVSQYYWWRAKGGGDTIDEYLARANGFASLKRKDSGLYRNGSEILVDEVYRYEDLDEALTEIRRRLDLPEELRLPRAKSAHRTDRRSYDQILTPAQRQRVREAFADELRYFGYET